MARYASSLTEGKRKTDNKEQYIGATWELDLEHSDTCPPDTTYGCVNGCRMSPKVKEASVWKIRLEGDVQAFWGNVHITRSC